MQELVLDELVQYISGLDELVQFVSGAMCLYGKTNLQYLHPGISHVECSVYGFDTFLSRHIAHTTPLFFDASASGVVERGFNVIIFLHIVGIEMIA